jgi:hypothetical protein
MGALLRTPRIKGSRSEHGFALWEMIVLLAVLAVFLAGVIVLASNGIQSLQRENADRPMSEKGEALMDRLEELTREAIVIYVSPTPYWLSTFIINKKEEILFAADLDGDASQKEINAFVSGGESTGGIEGVRVAQPDDAANELVARIRGTEVGDKQVVLTRILDAQNEPAFEVKYQVGKKGNLSKAELAVLSGGQRVTGLHIYLKLRDRGKTLDLDRAFRLNSPAPVRNGPEKDK